MESFKAWLSGVWHWLTEDTSEQPTTEGEDAATTGVATNIVSPVSPASPLDPFR